MIPNLNERYLNQQNSMRYLVEDWSHEVSRFFLVNLVLVSQHLSFRWLTGMLTDRHAELDSASPEILKNHKKKDPETSSG